MAQIKQPPRENLFRATSYSPTLDKSTGEGMPTMVVDFARFDDWTEINSIFEGRFMERLAPSSMDKTIAESRGQMKVLFNHGKDPSIGNKVLGPIEDITTTDAGARGVVPLLDTSYNRDLVPGLEHGLYGSSFAFQVIKDEFVSRPKRSDYNPEGIPERTLTEIRVREWGPVTFPAYANASSGLRSLTDEFIFGSFINDPDRLRELITAAAPNKSRIVVSKALPVAEVRDEELPSEVTAEVEPEQAPERDEPEPSEATTHEEPEPSAATTHSGRGLFLFTDTPAHLRSK